MTYRGPWGAEFWMDSRLTTSKNHAIMVYLGWRNGGYMVGHRTEMWLFHTKITKSIKFIFRGDRGDERYSSNTLILSKTESPKPFCSMDSYAHSPSNTISLRWFLQFIWSRLYAAGPVVNRPGSSGVSCYYTNMLATKLKNRVAANNKPIIINRASPSDGGLLIVFLIWVHA